MDVEFLRSSQNKVIEKLNKTTKRIQKARKNTKIAEKEAAEFEEIHKILNGSEILESTSAESEFLLEENESSKYSTIPLTSPGLKVFHEELVFSLFSDDNCSLKDFIRNEEKCLIFGKNESIPTEKCFRKLIVFHVTENLMPEQESCSSISLYVLYLMSVHPDPDFVTACFSFLEFRTFLIRPEDIFPIFLNFGVKCKDLFGFYNENPVKKLFEANENNGGVLSSEFPFFNIEMVGRILLQYINKNLLVVNSNIKLFVKSLAKIVLDRKIRSGSLLPIYSTILSIVCAKIQKNFSVEEILTWVYLKEVHLLNQLELCQNISRPIFSDLHESLILKILSEILKTEILPARPPIKINHIKSVLRKLRSRELPLLELFSLLQLINFSLPSLTATIKDSTEINILLTSLEQKMSKTEDSVDLIRLKLELAKVGNMVTNSIKKQ